jgi:aerobic-type carbon monoxide dehydrogenase small subunit (CoxS/CutS family)
MFAVQAEGGAIRTVEGLANGNELHPAQQAFIDNHGLQCGFCTPGFLMLATGVLERGSTTRTCRRAGVNLALLRYPNIIKAVGVRRA